MQYEIDKVINGITSQDYHAHDALSSSDCKNLLISPMHYKHVLEKPPESTKAMEFGTFFHTVVLEYGRVLFDYFIANKPKRNTKEGKAYYEALDAERGGLPWITLDDYNKALEMKRQIKKNATVKSLLRGGAAEQSVFWIDKESQTPCKARADYINLKLNALVDIKTTSSRADADTFTNTIKKYKYHLSAAFYVDGFKQATGQEMDFYIVAVETDAPFNFGVYKLDKGLIEQGRQAYRYALEVYQEWRGRGFDASYNNGNLVELAA